MPRHPVRTFFLCKSFAYVSDRTSLFFIWLVCCPMVGGAAAAVGAAFPPASSLGRFLLLMAGKLRHSAALFSFSCCGSLRSEGFVKTTGNWLYACVSELNCCCCYCCCCT